MIEVRRDEDSGRDLVQVVSRGSSVRTEELPPGDRLVDVPLTPLDVSEVRAWAHEVDAGGSPSRFRDREGSRSDGDVPQEVRDGSVVLDVQGDGQTLELRLPRVSAGGRR